MPHERPSRLDVAVAVAVLVAAEAELVLGGVEPLGVAMVTAFVASSSLAFRRGWPVWVVAVCVGSIAASTWAGVPQDQPVVPILWIFISLYSVASYCTLPRALLGLAIGLLLFASSLVTLSGDTLFALAIIGSPWLVGRAMRTRAGQATELAGRVADLEDSRDAEIRRAAEAERVRIARDLHDVVAHSVSVMVVQAGAAAEVIDRDPRSAADALASIQTVGREALTEMNALVGLLRADPEHVDGAPHPGLGNLASLLDSSRQSGLPTELVVSGTPRPVPPGLQLSIYRVVQEALTNARKHASGGTARVCLTYGRDELQVEIVDDGTATGDGAGGRLGIVGMTERVAAYKGTLDAGALPGRGFAVRATVPLEPAS